MNRRKLGLLSSASLLAVATRPSGALANTSNAAELLSTTLTPFGSERAGNADGTIPAWTGGFTTVPADWNPNNQIVPDFWAGEAPLYTVDSSNMAQYASKLSPGIQQMMQKLGFSIKVYQTHRTHAQPQWVSDNVLANATRAVLNPAGGRLGFTGGYGGVPFPILDQSDPLAAGAQVIWNHQCRWNGTSWHYNQAGYVVQDGGAPQLALGAHSTIFNYYYDPSTAIADYNGYLQATYAINFAPPTAVGLTTLTKPSTDPLVNPQITWEVLQGEGRIRKAPELKYDTPSQFADGAVNIDQYYGFDGPMDKYDWKLIGKEEILIPYNNNGLAAADAMKVHLPKFIDPGVMRWELHRVWVVEATLHPGERNTLARRVFYVDEDTWMIGLADAYDAANNFVKEDMVCNICFPNLPGTVFLNSFSYNLQNATYVSLSGVWGNAPYNAPWVFGPVDMSLFDPQELAAQSSY